MILSCGCTHQAQDGFHGKGKRVHNFTKKHTARCTVCKAEKTLTSEQIKATKKEE